MKIPRSPSAVLFILTLAFPFPALAPAAENAGDWPQWRGPNRDGISKETGLLKKWPQGGPPLAWKATGLGEGYSSVSVARGRLFTMGTREGKETVFALEASSGKEVWAKAVAPARRHDGGGAPGPRCTPTVDGDLLYALGIGGDLACLEAKIGTEVWRKDLSGDFNGKAPTWGYSESPLVDGDRVLCTPGGEATIVALDRKSGGLLWKASIPRGKAGTLFDQQSGFDGAEYSSIIVAPVGAVKQYVQLLKTGVAGISARDGKFLWRYNKTANGTANIATPVFHAGCVFTATSYSTGAGLVKLEARGGGMSAKEIYFTKEMKNHHGGVVLVGEYLYGFDEGDLRCLDFKTGKTIWNAKEKSVGKGSIVFADGHLYTRSENGPVALVEATPRRYLEKGRFDQPDRSGKNSWPHPALAGGRLFLRDQDILLCYDVKERP